MNELAKEVSKFHEKLKSRRTNWDNHWEEVAYFVVPQKDNVYVKQRRSRGEKKSNKANLFDSTAIHSNELLAAALHGMLTNPSTFWFELSTGNPEIDKQDDVKLWLQRSVSRIHQVLNNSNFQTEIHEVFLDLGSFGTSSMRIEEDDELIMRFHARPINEMYIQENAKGTIDTVSREYVYTGRQILQQFGEEVFTQEELMKIKRDEMKEWDIIHLVRPRSDYDDRKKNQKNKPYASIHVLKTLHVLLKESGFDEFPYIVPRWSKISGETYGRSPAMKALPDIKMINQVMKATIQSAQKMVDPPLQVPDDGVLLPLKTSPGSLNYYRAGTKDRIEPLNTQGRPDLGFQLMEQIKLQIRQSFFIDQLQLNEGPQMTATEVIQRTEEKLRLLGPLLGRLHFELLKPLIDRVFGIMARKEQLPVDAPQILQGQDLEVRFSSMIARAQKTSELDNLNRGMQTIGGLMEADPSIYDNIDGDEIVKFVGDTLNLPQELFRKDKEREELRAQRQQAEQQASERQAALEQGQAANQMAQATRAEEGI